MERMLSTRFAVVWCVILCASTSIAVKHLSKGDVKQSLSKMQQENLAELVAISYNYKGSRGVDADDSDLFDCILGLVVTVDRHFTRTAPRDLRENLCIKSDNQIPRKRIEDVLKSLERQLYRMNRDNRFRETCATIEQEEREEILSRILAAFGRTCLKGRSVKFVWGDGPIEYVFGMIATRRKMALSIAVGLVCTVLASAHVVRRLVFAKTNRKLQRRCSCPLCKERLTVIHEIGEGAFGTVYKIKDDRDQVSVVKMIEVDTEFDVNELQEALDEAKHLISLHHRHVVGYNDVFIHRRVARGASKKARRASWDESAVQKMKKSTYTDFVCIAMEYCSEGTLLDTVQEGRLGFSGLVDSVRQICSALAYLHREGVVHCDVKLENIFIAVDPANTSRSVLKIGDFGLATKLRHRSHLAHSDGSKLRQIGSEDVVIAPSKGRESGVANASTSSTRMSRRCRGKSRPGYADHVAGGTIMYQSPETFEREISSLRDDDRRPKKFRIGAAVDVWALGLLMWEAATGDDVPQDPPYLGEIPLQDEDLWIETRRKMETTFATSLSTMIEKELKRTYADSLSNQFRSTGNPYDVLSRGRAHSVSAKEKREIFENVKDFLVRLFRKSLEIDPSRRPLLKDIASNSALDESTFFFAPIPTDEGDVDNGNDEREENASSKTETKRHIK